MPSTSPSSNQDIAELNWNATPPQHTTSRTTGNPWDLGQHRVQRLSELSLCRPGLLHKRSHTHRHPHTAQRNRLWHHQPHSPASRPRPLTGAQSRSVDSSWCSLPWQIQKRINLIIQRVTKNCDPPEDSGGWSQRTA